MEEGKAWLEGFASRFVTKCNEEGSYELVKVGDKTTNTGGYCVIMESKKLPEAFKIELWLDEYVTHKTNKTKMLWVGFYFAGDSIRDKIRDAFSALPTIDDRHVTEGPSNIKCIENLDKINGFEVGKEALEYYEENESAGDGYLGKYFDYKDPHECDVDDELLNESYKYVASNIPKLIKCLS